MSDFENQQNDQNQQQNQYQDPSNNNQRSFSEVEFNNQAAQPQIDPQFAQHINNNNNNNQFQQEKTLYSQADEDTPYEPQITNNNFTNQQYQQEFNDQQYNQQNNNQSYNNNNQDNNFQASMQSNGSQQQQQSSSNQNNGQSVAEGIINQYKQHHNRLPEFNYTLSLLLMFVLPFIGELASDATTAFQFGGIGIFLIYLCFSISGMYGVERKSNLSLLIYQHVSFVYALGFIAIFVTTLITLISNETYEYYAITKTQTVMLLVISLPMTVWMLISCKVMQQLIEDIKEKTE